MHQFVGRFNEEVLEQARHHNGTMIYVDYKREYKWVDQLKKYLYNKQISPDMDFVREASKHIEHAKCDQLIIWGDLRLVRLFRWRFPEHTIAYAQRFYEHPDAKSSDYNHADILLVLSENIAQFTYSKYGQLYPNVLIIPNGVDLEIFKPVNDERKGQIRDEFGIPQDKIIVLYPAKIHGKKGANQLYRWIIYSQLHMPNLYFLIIGQATGNIARGDKSKLIRHLEHSPNSKWFEFVPRIQMPKYFQLSDIALFPSVGREGMSMAAIEAIASGVPIIAADRGIFPEIVNDGKTGILCRPEHLFSDGVHAFDLLAKNSDLRTKMGKEARIYATKKLSREKCLENFDAFFRGDWMAINSDLSF